jgi:hypothetical protein
MQPPPGDGHRHGDSHRDRDRDGGHSESVAVTRPVAASSTYNVTKAQVASQPELSSEFESLALKFQVP